MTIHMLSKLSSSSTTKAPYTFFIEYFNPNGEEKEGFNSRPSFQRNVVWGVKERLKFIESIFFGIVPSPIIIGYDKKNNKICIDGKQRIRTLVLFFTNVIPFHIAKDNKIILYWFSKIQEDKNDVYQTLELIYKIKNFENKLITPEMKCWVETEIQLTIIQYKDVEYEQQIDIFNRIQYGMTISRGSYLKSFISDAKLCEKVIEISNKYLEYFDKYVKNANNEDHIKIVIEYFLMLENSTVSIKSETVEYELKKLTLKTFNKLDEKYDNLFLIMFDKELLNFNVIRHKKVIIKLLLFAKEKMDLKTFDKEKMKIIIKKIYNEINENKKQFKTKELEDLMNKYWDNKNLKICKKVCKTNKSNLKNDSDDETEDSDNETEDSDIDNNIHKTVNTKSKSNKTLIK